jgi:seryl-tRNA synthetase
MRASFRGGYERKLKAYDQGYQAKFQSLATERQSLAAERQKLQEEYREREQAIQAMLYGDQDPTKEWQEKLAATQAEAKTWQEKAEAHEAQQRSAMAEALITDAETDMPDVFGDDKLFNRYLDLVLAGTPVVEAKTMVRALIDKGPDLSPTRAERALDVRDTPRSVHVSRMSSFEEAKKAFLES